MSKTYIADKATLDSVKTTVEGIDTKAGSIKTTGEDTNTKVGSVKTTVETTSGKVDTVQTTANTISTKADTILSELRGQRPKRYGYRVKESESNPSSRVEYLFDAVGMTPAAMNYTSGAFNFGGWADIWFVRDNFPCMVNNDGTVAYQLDPSDYSKKAVTGAASDVSNTAFAGNAMSAIPLVWVKRYHENGYRYVIFCETQYDEGYKAYAHTRPDGTISPFAYGPMFEGSKIDTKLRSLSGQAPVSSLNATAELTAAQANGDAWTITTWSFWNLIHDLLVLIHRDRVTIRKSILKRTRAKANHIYRKKRYTRHDAASMVSRIGAFKHADAYGYYLTYIKPKVSIHYCKRRIAAAEKKKGKE